MQPIIDYGASVWGQTEHSCINAVHNRACRFFLGVGRYTPNLAVQADMGWTSPWQRRWACIARLWLRFCKLPDDRLTKRIFLWAHTRARNYCKNWVFRTRAFFAEIQMQHLSNIETMQSSDTRQSLKELNEVLFEENEIRWYAGLMRPGAVRGAGQNKLRTYRTFKKEWVSEPYVSTVNTRSHRSALAKFRCGVAPLRLETGRYERGRLPVEQRICILCDKNEVEDESHAIFRCSLYDDLRAELMVAANVLNEDFNDMPECDQLSFLLSDECIIIITARVLSSILSRRQRLFYA